MFDALMTAEGLISLATLSALEIVLGIDNVIFITILASRLPKSRQRSARRWGIIVALLSRIVLLASITWLMSLKNHSFSVLAHRFTVHDLVLIVGGLFLMAKSATEIYRKVEGEGKHGHAVGKVGNAFGAIMLQVMLIDIVFSLDSVITAVGLAQDLTIMVLAVLVGAGIMFAFAGPIGDFVEDNPGFKILALSFLVMVGVLLVAEGFGEHLNRGYVYFGMVFSASVEWLNKRYDQRRRSLVR